MKETSKLKMKNMISRHEGKRNFPYTDTLGNLTIGIGYNLSDRGLSDHWINEQYQADVRYFDKLLTKDFAWYDGLSDVRKAVLIDMCFMGYKKFKGFYKMLNALSQRDYQLAANEMLDSLWATQVKGRSQELATMMATDTWGKMNE